MLFLKSSSLLSCVLLLTITADLVHSKYVYQPKAHREIGQYKEVATWEEAKQHCESEGATLASPITEDLLQYMKEVIAVNNHTTPYFIGFKARHNVEFRSEEGILLEDVPEAFDMVEQIDPREGDCLCMDGHNIRVEPCWSRLPFICYTNGTSTAATTTEIPTTVPENKTVHCGPEYKRYSTGCYKQHKESVVWESAVQECVREGAHLVVINDSAEAEIVTDLTKIDSPYNWVGLRDITGNDDWVSVTGELIDELYHVWAKSHTPAYTCGALKFTAELDDLSCENMWPFVCEKRGVLKI